MRIYIYAGRRVPRPDVDYPFILLFQDNWNDFGIRCRFVAELRISEEESVELGGVRIAVGKDGFRADETPALLDRLPRAAVSMGESVVYYRALREAPRRIRDRYLKVMSDMVADPRRRAVVQGTKIWEDSFMRESASRHALKRGGYYIGAPTENMQPPRFTFSMQLPGAAAPHEFEVDFKERSGLPHRTMLLIGRNGTGKTRCLAGLVSAITPPLVLVPDTRVEAATLQPEPEISRLIAISYNAFDEFPLPRRQSAIRLEGVSRKSRHSYKYCGLRNEEGEIRITEVGIMLHEALEPVADSDRVKVLLRVLGRLLGPDLAKELTGDDTRTAALSSLSAGQRLVAAIFTNIIGFVEEGSLLLIDEPETHLHPGLLSSVAAALDDVLEEFDSYAIIATHSPFFLQQVPSPYVRVFRRINDVPQIRPLEIESFGEDLGELERTVLGLAAPEKDFTSVLDRLHAEFGSAERVQDLFPHPLGLPARLHLYALDEDRDVER